MLSDALAERKARRQPADPVTDEVKQGSVDVEGTVYSVDTAETIQTFDDANTILTNDAWGFPRGAEVIAGRQLGQTPLMELTKNVITDQLTGGDLALPFVEDAEAPQALEDFRDFVQALLARDHVGGMGFDDLITAFVSDAVDVGWGYWERIPSTGGEIPVLQLKPVDALTIQHNLNDHGQFEFDDPDSTDPPAFYHAPAAASATGSIQPAQLSGDPTPLAMTDLVMLRAPGTARSNDPYGTPPAVKAREWLEIQTNATADINRDYDDTQIPEGIIQVLEGDPKDLATKLRQSSADKRKAPIVPYEVTWESIGFDTTEKRIVEQEWFWKMLMAMFGYSRNEIGQTENTGLGTETPAQATLIYKKIFLPFANTITTALRWQALPLFDQYDGQFEPELQGTDPRQEVVQQEEARKDFQGGVLTLNETRQTVGEDPIDEEATIEVGDVEIDWANTPRWVVEQLIRVELKESGQDGTESDGADVVEEGPPDFDADPVLSEPAAADVLDFHHPGGNLAYRIKQLADTVDVQSSFIVSIGYFRPSSLLQIEFEKEGQNAIYWYADVPESHMEGSGSFFAFLRSSSKGQYFNTYIRHTGVNSFDYVRIQ